MSSARSYSRLAVSAALTLGLGLITASPALAGPCASTTSCTLDFTQANSSSNIGSGNFGAVTLTLGTGNAAGTVTVSIVLNSNFGLINTGFPNGYKDPSTGKSVGFAVGFNDSLGGGLSFSNFSSISYSGGVSLATQTLGWDGFGNFSDSAGTTSLGNQSGLNTLSFVVSGGITDVNELVLPSAATKGGDGTPYFVVDVYDSTLNKTGLLGAFIPGSPTTGGGTETPVPEPASLALLAVGLFGLVVARRRVPPATGSASS